MLDEREGGRHQIHPCFRTIFLTPLHGVGIEIKHLECHDTEIETNELLSTDSFDL
jgi:hypothetical protein